MSSRYVRMKKAELVEELLHLEKECKQTRKYLAITGVMMVAINKDGIVDMVNPCGCRILGRDEAEIVGKNWFDEFIPERNRRLVRAVFRQVVSGDVGAVEYFENPVLTDKGNERTILWHNTAIINEKGEITGTLSSGQDITKRKRIMEMLKESEKNWRMYFENISDIIFSCSRDLLILNVSPSAERILGYGLSELEGRRALDIGILTPASLERAKLNVGKVFEGESVHVADYEVIAKDGAIKDFEIVTNPLFHEGEIDAVVCVARDISERRKAEEARRELEAKQLVVDQLRKLDRLKSEFVSTVTHELRTPMTPLKSSVELLLDGSLGALSGEQKKFIEMMARNIDRLSHFTTEVLTLSRIESGKYQLHCGMIDIVDVITPVIELVGEKAARKNCDVGMDISEGLAVYADADVFGQVVINLINNAIVHNPEGTCVTVSASKKGNNSVEISVSDDGKGIPENALENIFERFYQSGRESGPGYRGTGIGLSVCKAFVEAMGGVISVFSRDGEGTEFKFTLPTDKP